VLESGVEVGPRCPIPDVSRFADALSFPMVKGFFRTKINPFDESSEQDFAVYNYGVFFSFL